MRHSGPLITLITSLSPFLLRFAAESGWTRDILGHLTSRRPSVTCAGTRLTNKCQYIRTCLACFVFSSVLCTKGTGPRGINRTTISYHDKGETRCTSWISNVPLRATLAVGFYANLRSTHSTLLRPDLWKARKVPEDVTVCIPDVQMYAGP